MNDNSAIQLTVCQLKSLILRYYTVLSRRCAGVPYTPMTRFSSPQND